MFPFRGWVITRPYPETGLTTARWATEVPTETVAIERLWLTQVHLRVWALFGLDNEACDAYPHVVAYGGELYLEDGHHRVVRSVLRGSTAMTMRVFRGWAA